VAKQSGLGDNLYVAGVDLSGDTSELGSITGGPALLDVTGINKSAHERLGGRIDGSLELTSWFNDTGAHTTWSALPTADVTACYLRGTTIGNAAAGIVAKQVNYDGTRAADGSWSLTVQLLANGYGLEWGKNLTAGIRTDGGATNGTAVDYGAAQDLGLRAYLQVVSFTGTDATIAIQDSADGSTGWADVTSFTEVTSGPVTERIETGATENVKRYLRARTTTTGGFTDLQFAVVAIQNDVTVSL
jgi:hypothetical protein